MTISKKLKHGRNKPAAPNNLNGWLKSNKKINYKSRIRIDPDICHGHPCIKGTRVLVSNILATLAEGCTPEQVIEHFPVLKLENIQAALAYAAELSNEKIYKIV